jgi:hypothetical protein
MLHSAEKYASNLSVKPALTLVLHQLIATYGVAFTAPVIFSLGSKVLFLLGYSYSKRDFYSTMTETPYFPVQIVFALALGWLLGRSLRHRSMLWVWVLPLAVLCYAMIAIRLPMAERASVLSGSFPGHTLLSHFFGRGCRPANHCFDQVLITLPFYTSLAYSVGGLVGRNNARLGQPTNRVLFLIATSAGSLIILAVVIDLIISVQQTGWQQAYWLVLATPVGLGVFVLYVASTIPRTRTPLVR